MEPKPGIHKFPIPDKYGQQYLLVQKEAGRWVATGDRGERYSLTYEGGPKPKGGHVLYFTLLPLSKKQVQDELKQKASLAEAFRSQVSFLEQFAQAQPDEATQSVTEKIIRRRVRAGE